jgi:hypothetical protein
MAERHTLVEGECLSSIAFERGFFRKTLEEHPENAALLQKRGDLNILVPGDVMFIPDRVPKSVPAATGTTHRFRRRGVPEVICIRLRNRDGEPRAALPYTFLAGTRLVEGKTDAEGRIRQFIPPNAESCEVRVAEGTAIEIYRLDLGKLAPIDTIRGVQQRLRNLGHLAAPVSEVLDDDTRSALSDFQSEHDLPRNGEIDGATIARLKTIYQE